MRAAFHITLALLLAGCGDAGERAAEDALYAGNRHYKADRHASALEAYEAGASDPRVAHNAGMAHLRLHAWDAAIAAFTDAAQRLPDTAQQAMAWHHAGHVRLMEALAADSLHRHHTATLGDIRIEGDDIALNVERFVLRDSLRRELRRLDALIDSSLAQGAAADMRALRLMPTHEDARHDLALARHLIGLRPGAGTGQDGDRDGEDQEKELGVRAMRIIQQADSLVDAYRFQEALGVLEQGLREDPTLEQRKEYMDKLDLVTKAAEAE